MKRRSLWLMLFAITLISALISALISIGGGWVQHMRSPSSEANAGFSQQISAISAPLIDRPRLFADLKALSFRRFAEGDRQRARDYILQSLTAAGWTPQLQGFDGGANIVAERKPELTRRQARSCWADTTTPLKKPPEPMTTPQQLPPFWKRRGCWCKLTRRDRFSSSCST